MRLSDEAANASTDAVTARLAGGTLRIFGDPMPETPDGDPGEAQLLTELRWPSPAFPAASKGLSVSYPLASGTAIASGNPTWAQAVSADGAVVFDERVNQGDDSLQIEPEWLEAGGVVIADHIAYVT